MPTYTGGMAPAIVVSLAAAALAIAAPHAPQTHPGATTRAVRSAITHENPQFTCPCLDPATTTAADQA